MNRNKSDRLFCQVVGWFDPWGRDEREEAVEMVPDSIPEVVRLASAGRLDDRVVSEIIANSR